MSESIPRAELIRQLRHHLESMRRAGLTHLPITQSEMVADSTATKRVRSNLEGGSPTLPSDPGKTSSSRKPSVQPTPEIRMPEAASKPSSREPRPQRPASSTAASAPSAMIASLFEEPGFDRPEIPVNQRQEELEKLAQQVSGCQKCAQLAQCRNKTVFGTGPVTTRLMFVGEAPGADEDRLGEPFVGRAGKLLDDILTKGMGLKREEVYIANILKCRPPENRNPLPDERSNCLPYLEEQIDLIRPDYLCLLGAVAAQTLLDTALSMGRLRKKWHRYRGIPSIATYHPAYLLRNPSAKAQTWDDLKMLMAAMKLPLPGERKES